MIDAMYPQGFVVPLGVFPSNFASPRQTMKKMAMLQTAETKAGGVWGFGNEDCWTSVFLDYVKSS